MTMPGQLTTTSNQQPIQVAIADDHAVVREGLKSILASVEDIEFRGEAADGEEAIQLYNSIRPDVLLLDVAMPKLRGLDAVSRIRQYDANARLLIFTMYPEAQYAIPYLRAGVNGYFEKCGDTDALLAAIRQVASGKTYISPQVASMLAQKLADSDGAMPHETLSSKEYLVMQNLASGKSITQTAQAMSLSVRTISTYRKRIMSKMQLRNTAELVQYAFRHKLLEP